MHSVGLTYIWRILLTLALCLVNFQARPVTASQLAQQPGSVLDLPDMVYAGGSFTNSGGVGARYAASFDGSNWKHVGTDLNGVVRALLPDGNGGFYIGGEFSNVDGSASINHIAHNADGVWEEVDGGLNSTVHDMLLNGEKLYAAGSFSNAGGIAEADGVAVLDKDGWHALGSGVPSGTVRALAYYSGNLYAGGYFLDVGGMPAADHIIVYTGQAWLPVGGGFNNTVYDLLVVGSELIAAGAFTDAGGDPAADYIARWDGVSWKSMGNGLSGPVYSLAVNGTDLYIGGSFTNAGGESNADNVALLDAGIWKPLGSGFYNPVNALAYFDGKLFAGGEFSDPVAGTYISMWNGSSWSMPGGVAGSAVTELAADTDRLLVGGGFYYVGGDPTLNRFGAYDGVRWSSLNSALSSFVSDIVVTSDGVYISGNFLNAGGNPQADRIARWDGSNWQALGSGLLGLTETMLSSSEGLVAGGTFLNAGGNPNASYIARWTGSAWQPLGAGLNDTVYALARSGSNLYAGGDFLDAGGVASADYIAQWNGAAWQALGSGLSNTVYALAADGTNVYAGGLFTDAGGNTSADRIALWNGASWQALGSGAPYGSVKALLMTPDGLYAGGSFGSMGGVAGADYLALWTGGAWHAVGNGLNTDVNDLAYDSDTGLLYAGGLFFNAGGDPDADYLARLNGGHWEAVGAAMSSEVKAVAVAPFVEVCNALGSVSLSGPSTGMTGETLTYTATLSPSNASAPFTFTFSTNAGVLFSESTDALSMGAEVAFNTAGADHVSVSVQNCGSTVQDTLPVTITAPVAITQVNLNGPASLLIDENGSFTASLVPSNATPPFTYTWVVTDHPDVVYSNNGIISTRVLSWTTPGDKTVQVTVENAAGAVVNSRSVTVTVPPVAVNDVTISGPVTLPANVFSNFTANLLPVDATPPFTYTWVVTDHADSVINTSEFSSTRNLSWSTPGEKTVQVTASNAVGSAVETHTVTVTEALPDLTIESIWREGSVVHYTLRNQPGSGSAASGHITGFWIGFSLVSQQVVPQNLKGGATFSGVFDAPWSCPGLVEQAKVCADRTNLLDEKNETNNCKEVTWDCEAQGPQIVTPPQVSAITQNGAVVTITSDISARGKVKFGTTPAALSAPVSSTESGVIQTINLTGLQPGTSYYYEAWSETRGGKSQVYSGVFTTQTPPSSTAGITSIQVNRNFDYSPYQFYQVDVYVTDIHAVQRVRATLDGKMIGVKYTPSGDHFTLFFHPKNLGFTYDGFFDVEHDVWVGIDSYGEEFVRVLHWTPDFEARYVSMHLLKPVDGAVVIAGADPVPVGTKLNLQMYAAAYDWNCTRAGHSQPAPDGQTPVTCSDNTNVDQMRIRIPNTSKIVSYSPSSGELMHDFSMDLGGLALGSYELKADASVDDHLMLMDTSTQFDIQFGAPDFEVTRQTRLVDTHFDVTLVIKNTGTYPAYFIEFGDTAFGMQTVDETVPCRGEAAAGVYCQVSVQSLVTPTLTEVWMRLALDGAPSLEVLPGETLEFTYRAVPILYQVAQAAGFDNQQVKLVCLDPAGKKVLHTLMPNDNGVAYNAAGQSMPFSRVYPQAVANANYLLITNPSRLSSLYGNADHLIATMAHLAVLKHGVLGFIGTYDDDLLDDLLDPDEHMGWVEQMHPDFALKNRGYVLLVGESEIIPSWYLGHNYFTTYAGIPDEVYQSDLPYANTGGNTARPELALGRVIGDNVDELLKVLDTSIAQALGKPYSIFDRSNALLISGTGDGASGYFRPDINIIEDVLQDDGWIVDKQHWSYVDDKLENFKAEAGNQDIIVFRDHGNVGNWDDLGTNIVYETSFGLTAPFAFAAACLAGNYDSSERDDDNMAQSFLDQGAGAYIGSTQISERSTNSYAIKYFFRHWPAGTSIAVALNNTKIATWDTDSGAEAFDHEKMWAYEFNLYGDPKFGVDAPPSTSSRYLYGLPLPTFGVLAAPSTSLDLNLPALEVENVEGFDQVTIPDGSVVLEPGYYQVPRYVKTIEIPAGYQVTNLHLTNRSGLEYLTDLNIPLMQAGLDCTGCTDPDAAPAQDLVDGWTSDPSNAFEWSVEYNSDGSSTLTLRLFPFYYNPETKAGLYYPDYEFGIDYLQNPAEITSLLTDGADHNLGAAVPITVSLNNPGAEQDYYLNVRVLFGDGSIAAGLPVTYLPALTGSGVITLPWDTTGLAADRYTILAELLDGEGRQVDQADSEVALGKAVAVVTAEAVPSSFKLGQAVNISLRLTSSGESAVSGWMTILVQSTHNGVQTLATFTQQVTDLAAGSHLVLPIIWNSAGAPQGPYRILAYIQYQEGVSEPLVVPLELSPTIYLPMVIK